ncbi:MAG: L-threonylcarbamoyladenylate synthase [Acidimicrobiales bacterium]
MGLVIEDLVVALEAGGVVGMPTDTVYGLIARATDPAAARRLFELKGRSDDVPLAVLCATVDQALDLSAMAEDPAVVAVAGRWWPGPLTLVLPRRAGVELHLGEPVATIGLRVPDDARVRALAARVGPLAATSANRHGEPVAVTAEEVREALGGGLAAVLDGGRLGARSSTVIDATGSPWRVLRDGPLDAAEIFATARDAAG